MQNLEFFPTLDNLWNRPTVIINFDVQIFTYWETKIGRTTSINTISECCHA